MRNLRKTATLGLVATYVAMLAAPGASAARCGAAAHGAKAGHRPACGVRRAGNPVMDDRGPPLSAGRTTPGPSAPGPNPPCCKK